MSRFRQVVSVATLLLGVGAEMTWGQIQTSAEAEIARLRRENRSLRESIVAANTREKDSREKLQEISLQLEAMGVGLIDGSDDRLVKAVADLEVLSRKLKQLEDASLALANSTQSYLTSAIAADPESRMLVEAQLRQLELVLGLREKPQPDRQLGRLAEARIVSVDSESGVLVANVGDKASAVIGMPFEVSRNGAKIADAIVALTRSDVSALLITDLENEENPVRRGDRVSFKRS